MNKTTKILVGAIAILSIGAGGYAYLSSNSGEESFIGSFVKKTLNKEKDNSLNYSFNTKASLKVNKRGRENGFDLEIKNASIITKDSGLKERIQLEEANLEVIGEDKINFKNIDIISDNEKIYLKGDLGENSDIKNLFSSKILEKINSNKYIKIDNSKPILDILGELGNNELIKELAVGMTTSNPEKYYKKNKTIEKLLTTLKTDYLINYVFKDGDYNETTKKTSLLFNEKLCELTSVVNKSKAYPFGELTKKDCEASLKQANSFLSFVNIYKEGDSKAGNYKFVINQGSAIDISLDYKNHIIDTWALSIAEPTGKFVVRANGNTKKVLSSLVKINIDENGIKANGEIKDGKGKIVISSDKNSEFTLNGFLDVSEYSLNSYELNGESGDIKLISKANKEEGELKITTGEDYSLDINYKDDIFNLDLKSKEVNATGKADKNKLTFNLDAKDYSGKQIAKIDLKADYSSLSKANYDLDLFIDKELKIKSIGNLSEKKLDLDFILFRYNGKKDFSIDFKSDFKEEKITLNTTEFNYNGEERDSFNFNYNKGKIKGNYGRRNRQNNVYVGNFKNLGEFDLKIEFPGEDALVKVIGKKEEEKYKYNLDVTLKGEKYAEGKAEIKIEDNKIISNGELKAEKEKLEVNYNVEFNYKKGEAKYDIPKEFEEVEIGLGEMSVLPNFEDFGNYENKKVVLPIVTGGAILGTVAYISFEGYNMGARDTNRISQLKSMSDALELYRTKKDLPLPDDYIEIKSNGEIIAYQGYIGKNVLETIEYTFTGLDPKNKTYFTYYLTKDRKNFELMAFLEESKGKTYTIGKKLGILINNNNIEMQSAINGVGLDSIDISSIGQTEKSVIKGNFSITGTKAKFLY